MRSDPAADPVAVSGPMRIQCDPDANPMRFDTLPVFGPVWCDRMRTDTIRYACGSRTVQRDVQCVERVQRLHARDLVDDRLQALAAAKGLGFMV